jgi:hypothetical protein
LGEDLSVPAAAAPFLSKQCIQFWVLEDLGFVRFQGSSSALSQQKVPCEFVDFHPLLLWVHGRPKRGCRETLARILFRSFSVVGSQYREGKMEMISVAILLLMVLEFS